MAAWNEEKVIEEKIINTYQIDYPKDRTDFYNSFYQGNEFKDIGIDKIVIWYNKTKAHWTAT